MCVVAVSKILYYDILIVNEFIVRWRGKANVLKT